MMTFFSHLHTNF